MAGAGHILPCSAARAAGGSPTRAGGRAQCCARVSGSRVLVANGGRRAPLAPSRRSLRYGAASNFRSSSAQARARRKTRFRTLAEGEVTGSTLAETVTSAAAHARHAPFARPVAPQGRRSTGRCGTQLRRENATVSPHRRPPPQRCRGRSRCAPCGDAASERAGHRAALGRPLRRANFAAKLQPSLLTASRQPPREAWPHPRGRHGERARAVSAHLRRAYSGSDCELRAAQRRC